MSRTMEPLSRALQSTPIMGASPPAWIRPTLLNFFEDYGGEFATSGFHRDALGYVWMKGVLINNTGAAATTPILILPSGYRPGATSRFMVLGPVTQAISINASGVVVPLSNLAAGDAIDLACSFLAER